MTINTHHEEAILHENAAKAHLIAAKRCEDSARADREAGSRRDEIVEVSGAWYHADALKDSGPTHTHKA